MGGLYGLEVRMSSGNRREGLAFGLHRQGHTAQQHADDVVTVIHGGDGQTPAGIADQAHRTAAAAGFGRNGPVTGEWRPARCNWRPN